MAKLEPGYILTKLGRKQGYVGRLKESEIDDSVRGAFAVLREEDEPVVAVYIQYELPRLSLNSIELALRKLVRASLVKEVE